MAHNTMDDMASMSQPANNMGTTMAMSGTSMPGMNMSGTGMDMSGTAMPGMDMSGTSMPGMNMSGTGMRGMDMSGTGMPGMDMSGTGMPGMEMHNMSMPGMKMYFHEGYKEYVLFEPCLTSTVGAMIGACFIIFFVAILYEGLKFLREYLLQRSSAARRTGAYNVNEYKSGSSREQINTEVQTPSFTNQILSFEHLIQTGLHMVQVFISYCLMLVFMTYNVWLCLAVIVGAGVGYFCFGWKRAVVVDANEHCH